MPLEINNDKLVESFDKMTSSLEKLDKRLQDVGKNVNAFDKLFGSTKNFDEFVVTIKKLDQVSAQSFSAIASGLASITRALAKMPKNSNSLRDTLETLKLFFKELPAIKVPSAGAFDKFFSALKTTFDTINSLSPYQNTLRKSLDATSFIIYSFVKLANQDFGKVDNLKKLTDGISAVVQSIARISTEIQAISGFKEFANFSTIINAISGVVTAFIRLSGDRKALTDPAATASGIATFISTITNTVGTLKVDPKNISAISSLIDQYFKLSSQIATQGSKQPGRFDIIGRIKEGAAIGNFFRTVRQIFDGIGKATSGLRENVDLDSLSKIVRSITQIVAFVPQILALGKSMPGFLDFSARFKQFIQLQKFFSTAKSIIQGITKATAGVAKSQTEESLKGIRSLSTVLLQVSQALPSILEAGKNLKVGNFFTGPLFKFFNQGSFKAIKQFTTVLKFMLQSLKGLPKNVPDIGNILKGIADFAKELSSGASGAFNKESLAGFSDFIKELAKPLKELNGIKIDGTKAAALAQQLSALKELRDQASSANIGGVASKLQSQISSAGKGGDSVIKQVAVNVITQAVQAALTGAGRIIATFTDVKRAAAQMALDVGNSFKTVAQGIKTAADTLNNFGLGALQNSDAFGIASEFEKTSSLLEAAGLNNEQLQLAQDFADTIGIQYPLSANQALDAILDLTRAGRDLSEVEFILPNASDLAALAGGDLEGVTQTLIGVAGAFTHFTNEVEGGFSTIETATNLISAAADVGTSTVSSLSQALANVGPSANAAGLNLQETLAILTQFEDANIRGAEAGTQLRSVLNSFASPKARDELRRLGVTTVNADGSLRDLNLIIQDINDSYQRLGLTESQRQLSINQLADSYARQGLNVLLLRDGFDATIDAMNGSASAANKAQQSMNNLAGDTEQLRGSLETLYKDVLYPLINRAFRPLTQLALQLVNALLQLPDPIKDIVTTGIQLVATFASIGSGILIVVAALTALGGTVLAVGGKIALMVVNLPVLIAQFAALAGSIALALPVIAAVGAAFLTLSYVVSSVYRVIEQNVGGAGKSFEQFRATLGEVFSEVGRILRNVRELFLTTFGAILGDDLESRGNAVARVFDRLNDTFQNVRRALAAIDFQRVQKGLNDIIPFIGGVLHQFQLLGQGIFEVLTGNFDEGVNNVETAASNILSIVTDLVQRITGLHLGSAVAAFNEGDIRQGVSELFHAFAVTIRRLILDNKPLLEDAARTLLGFLNPFNKLGGIARFFGLDGVADALQNIGDTINTQLVNIFDSALRIISGEDVGDVLSRNFGEAGEAIYRVITQLQISADAIGRIFNTIVGIFSGDGAAASGAIQDTFGSQIVALINTFADALGFLNTRILIPFADALPGIISGVGEFSSEFVAAFTPLGELLSKVSEQFGNFVSGIEAVFSGQANIGNVIGEFIGQIATDLGKLPGVIGQVLSNLGDVFHSDFLRSVGDALQAGEFLSLIGNFIGSLLAKIPPMIIRLGESLGNNLIIGLGESLASGDILGFAQNLISLIGQALRAVTSGLVSLVSSVVGGFINQGLQDAALQFNPQNLVDQIGALGEKFAFSFARGYDYGLNQTRAEIRFSTATAIAGAFTGIADIIRTFFTDGLSFIPQLFYSLAEQAMNEYDRATLIGLGDIVKRITAAIGGLIALPVEAIGSVIRGLFAIPVIIERIFSGIDNTIRGLVGNVVGLFAGLGNIIIGTFANAGRTVRIILEGIVGTVRGVFSLIGGAIGGFAERIVDGISALFSGVVGAIQGFLGSIVETISRAFAGLANTLAAIFRPVIDIINGIIASFGGLGDAVVVNLPIITILLGALAFAFRNIGNEALIAKLKMAEIFVLITAGIIVIDSLGKAFASAAEGGNPILAFFEALAVDVLNLLGLGDLIPQVQENFRLLEIILNEVGRRIQAFFQNIADGIVVAFSDARNRAEEALTGGNASTRQFFAVGDALSANATLSATEFFSTLGEALANPQDINSLTSQLRQGATEIVTTFSEYLSSGGTIADLAAQGVLDDLVSTLTASGTLDEAFNALQGRLSDQIALFNELSPDEQRENLDAFFNASKTGLESNAEALQSFLGLLDQFVEDGAITAEQAAVYRNQLTPATQEATDALNQATAAADAQTQAAYEAQQAAIEYGYTLSGLQDVFSDTTQSAEDLGASFRDVVSGLTPDEIDLDQLFNLFNQLSPEEAAESFGIFFEAAIRGGVSRAGNEEYFQQLQNQIDNLRNSGLISNAQRRTFLDQLATDAQTASTALDGTASRLTQLQRLLQNSQARLEALRLAGKGTVADAPVVPPFDPNASGVDDYITDQEKEVSEKIADFARDEAKRLKDDLEDEKKAAAELEKLKYGVDQDELDRVSDFNKDTERREQDHQIALQKIRDTAANALTDAVASRDSTAAQNALKSRNEELKSEEDKFRLDEERRQEDEQLRIEKYEREREEKIAQAETDLQDLIAKHAAERLERQSDFSRELDDLRAKNDATAAQNQAAYQQVVSTNAQTVANTVSAANSIKSALTNALNSVLTSAGGGAKGGKGTKAGTNNWAGWDFSGLEETPVYQDPSKKKSINIPSLPYQSGNSITPPPVSGFKKGGVGVQSFEKGGRLPYTGIFMGHQDEQVLNRQQAQQWRAGDTNTSSVTVSPQITVNAAPSMDTNALVQQIEQRVVSETIRAIEKLPGGKI